MRRTPSLEMPPGKLERAKPLAREQDFDFSTSDRPLGREFFNQGPAERREEAPRTDCLNQSARP
jgi:hypothetical protein